MDYIRLFNKTNIQDIQFADEKPILKNDTANIIEYSDDIELYKKRKKKYTFWDLIKK